MIRHPEITQIFYEEAIVSFVRSGHLEHFVRVLDTPEGVWATLVSEYERDEEVCKARAAERSEAGEI